MNVRTKDLPDPVKRTLSAVGYHSKDIEIEAAESFHAPGGAGEGNRSYVAVVNLETGQHRISRGSWGGSNIFSTTFSDDSTAKIPIPPNSVVVIGQEGYIPYAVLYAAPGTLAASLPAAPQVSPRERQILAVFGGIKSSYRPQYLREGRVSDAEIESLISRKLLSKNKAGSISITTDGKNARGDERTPWEDGWVRSNPEEVTEGDAGGWKHQRLFRPQLVEIGEYSWKDDQITGSESAAKLIMKATEIHLSDRENIAVLCLNTKNFPMSVHVAATGGLGSVQADPTSIFRMAVASDASAIVIAHNHPSGDPTPSAADRRFTDDVQKAGSILGVRFLDHIVLGRKTYFSFLDEGILSTTIAK